MMKKNNGVVQLEKLHPKWQKLASEDYGFYAEYIHRGLYETAPHIDLITDKLQALEEGRTDKRKIMLFLPPRHSKSMTVTETFPSWYIGRNPERLVIEVSYNGTLAKKFGQRNLEKVVAQGDSIFDVQVNPKQSSAVNWGLAGHRGQMVSAGVGGTITGEGANLLIIDDPIKNRQEAYSKTYRDRLWYEYDTTLRSRLHSNAITILIMTRWHHDDLAGRILEKEGDEWEVIKLPAICKKPEEDLLGRSKGEPLWAKGGYDLAELKNRRKNMDKKAWDSLYQQNPSPEEGDIIKEGWWRYYGRLPDTRKFDRIIMSWDCAFKDNNDNSYVVGQVWGLLGPNAYLIDQTRDHLDFTSTIQEFKTMRKKWPEARPIYIEDTANGPAVINVLKKRIPALIPVTAQGSKVSRAYAVTPFIESGNVYVPHPDKHGWVNDFIDECKRFPEGEADDQVDAMTQALNKIYNASSLRPSRAKPPGF